MLICPQCQFENPIANKFCQQCGVSLTHNTCPDCGNLVAFKDMDCPSCGTVSGVTWLAIVGLESAAAVEAALVPPRLFDSYLDLQQRYRVLGRLSVVEGGQELQGQVLDCNPFQLSPLEDLVLKGLEEEAAAADREGGDRDDQLLADSMATLSIPAIAQTYITLCNRFYHVIPTIHNAWTSDGQTILLLEDRSDYPSMLSLWQTREAPPPMLQILEWLHAMSQLWRYLETYQCEQSLLVLENLRTDPEDQTLCLQRLYRNPEAGALGLEKLGYLWQLLFAESQTTHMDALSSLLSDLVEGKLTSVDLVQERIAAIAHTIQAAQASLISQVEGYGSDDDMRTDVLRPLPPRPVLPRLVEEWEDGGDRASVGTAIDAPPMDLDDGGEETRFDSDDPTVVLPMQLFNLEEVGRTDVGRQRVHNEDYFGIETQVVKLESPSGKTLRARNLYVLCDGMGGHDGGEVASALAVDTIRSFFKENWQPLPIAETGSASLPNLAMMTAAVLQANQAIYDVNQQNRRSGSARMGTTLITMLISDAEVAIAHVGDSRVYRYTRKRGLEQLTVDHEVGQREIQRGVDPAVAYSRPDAYQLTQALGPRDENFVKPDVQYLELNEDMLLLLCSDGLSDNNLLEKHWESHIHPLLSSQTNLDKGVAELIELANRYNGHDNITAIVVRVKVRPSLDHLR